MAEFSMYHALGGHPSPNASNPPGSAANDQQQTNQFRPPVAPGPAGYQQAGSAGPGPAPFDQPGGTPQYGGAGYNAGSDGQAYPSSPQPQHDGGMGGLTSQMGGMGFGSDAATHSRPKKKDRHAYHTLDAPAGSSQPFNGIPQGAVAPSQFLNQSQTGAGNPYGSPQMGQSPALVGGAFSPANAAGAASSVPLTGSPASSAQGRVDPEQIPSVPRSRDGPAQYYLDHVYPTMEQHLPPPSAAPFIAYDQGNSSPKFARLTLNNIPASSDALASTSLPLGLILQPLAKPQEGEQTVPILDFGETGPPRCRRCRAYINPFMTFRSGGNKFVCNMCTFPNDVPSEYFSPTDPSGVRVDRLQRPELTLGTVEFTVPKEYWGKEPTGLRWLFLIDVSAEAANRGFLDGFCEGIMSALYGNANPGLEGEDSSNQSLPPGAKVGIVTYDKEIHFYNLSSTLDQAQMLVMPDIEDPFVPLSEGLFVDPEESKPAITSLLTQLPTMFADVKNPEPALLPALNTALSALKNTGGKIVASLASLPTWGPGRLFLRDDGKMHGTDAEKKLLTTEHPGWKKTSITMVENGIGVDFFMAAPSGGYLDIATIGKS